MRCIEMEFCVLGELNIVGSAECSNVTRRARFRHIPYSYLSATVGSTFVARCAGKKHAANATSTSTAPTTTMVTGSSAFTSYNIDFR